jgi:hypothetical protein
VHNGEATAVVTLSIDCATAPHRHVRGRTHLNTVSLTPCTTLPAAQQPPHTGARTHTRTHTHTQPVPLWCIQGENSYCTRKNTVLSAERPECGQPVAQCCTFCNQQRLAPSRHATSPMSAQPPWTARRSRRTAAARAHTCQVCRRREATHTHAHSVEPAVSASPGLCARASG